MTQTIVTRTINAPVDMVFKTIADINNYSKAVPHIVSAEIVSDTKSGVGTRFRETRIMGGKEATTELEITEYIENDRVRIIADSHGTLWDTLFTVRSVGEGTELKLVMDARTDKIMSKVMNFLIKGMIKKAIEKDMDAVKAYCEK